MTRITIGTGKYVGHISVGPFGTGDSLMFDWSGEEVHNITEAQARELTQALLAVFPKLAELYHVVPTFKATSLLDRIAAAPSVKIDPADPEYLSALGDVAESLTVAQATEGIDSITRRDVNRSLRKVLAAIDQFTAGPQIATVSVMQAQPKAPGREDGPIPYVSAMKDPHWPLCWESKGGYATRRKGGCNLTVKEGAISRG